ncbi:MAG: hypothetical protein NWE96_04370 [Candidatus Bathyarchaeota archaeon]|nr:hypothetical protein [Candidatus Bathyarchaeota archaeon]
MQTEDKPLDLESVFLLHKKVGHISFSEVVSKSCKFKIIPIDKNSPEDKELVRHLTLSLNNFLKVAGKAGQRYTGARINDIGKNLETQIVEEIKKTPLEISKLSSSGYPDFELKQKTRVSYLEIKTTGNVHKDLTQHRMFYYSSGKKIKSDARHLLLQIQMAEEQRGYWKLVSWEIRDLSSLMVELKTEFNASFHDFGATPLLASSEPA